jgi:hypothetical protein
MEMETIKKIRVSNMESSRGNIVPNQFEIETDDGIYFQSYNTIIAYRSHGKRYLDKESWDYSRTTGKYRNIFLNETKKETEKKIKSGEYILTNLN